MHYLIRYYIQFIRKQSRMKFSWYKFRQRSDADSLLPSSPTAITVPRYYSVSQTFFIYDPYILFRYLKKNHIQLIWLVLFGISHNNKIENNLEIKLWLFKFYMKFVVLIKKIIIILWPNCFYWFSENEMQLL